MSDERSGGGNEPATGAAAPAGSNGANGAAESGDLRALIAGAVADDKKAADAPKAEPRAPKPETAAAAKRAAEPAEGASPAQGSEPGETEDGGSAAAAAALSEAAKPGAVAGAVEAPAHWSGADKALLAGLPEAARGPFLELYKRMEAGFTPKLQRGAQLERDYGEVDRAIFTAEQRRIIADKGVSPAQLIAGWADVERGLGGTSATLKSQIVARIIHGYGVDPGGVAEILHQLRGFAAQPPGSGDRGPPPSPNGAGAVAIDPALHQRLTALETETQRQRDERAAAAHRAAGDQIAAFANEKDGEGNLTHPFFAELEAEMTSLAQVELNQGRAPVLADLYDRALWATPSTREQHLASQRDAEARRAAEERRAKAEQARRAGSSVTGAPGPGQTRAETGNLSLRDQIKANMAVNSTSGGPGRI